MNKYIAVKIDGIIQIHMHDHTGNYDTLCGVDSDDPAIGHYPADVPKGAKIDCPDCIGIFSACRLYRKTDFKEIT